MSKRKAIALLALALLGFLLISCLKSALRVSNSPKTLHGQSSPTAASDLPQVAEGTATPSDAGKENGRHEPPIKTSARVSMDEAAGH